MLYKLAAGDTTCMSVSMSRGLLCKFYRRNALGARHNRNNHSHVPCIAWLSISTGRCQQCLCSSSCAAVSHSWHICCRLVPQTLSSEASWQHPLPTSRSGRRQRLPKSGKRPRSVRCVSPKKAMCGMIHVNSHCSLTNVRLGCLVTLCRSSIGRASCSARAAMIFLRQPTFPCHPSSPSSSW